jgi:hypothetical protein
VRLEGVYTATVDRIEEGLAVFLVEEDGETVAERHRPAADLPEDVGEGAVCELTFEDDDLVVVSFRPDRAAERRKRLGGKLGRLSRRRGEKKAGATDGTDESGEE